MSLLIARPVEVELEVAEHYEPKTAKVCDIDNHDSCDWEQILETGLKQLFPEIIISDMNSTNNIITFKVSYKNRIARRSDVALMLDQFFSFNKLLVLKSVSIK